MSRLRARCPACRTLTAVAVEGGYECHVCGRGFPAGLVRVPRAWGDGGEPMAEAALLPFPYPETAVVEEDSLREQSLAVASDLPEVPLIVGGCCCAHVGAVQGLAARHDRIAVVWLDAHGDLNTPETSPSGNLWGMPLRMLLDAQTVRRDDVALVGARSLDPGELDYIAESGLQLGREGVAAALDRTDGVYVALDCDVLDPEAAAPFMPEPGGISLDEAEELLARLAQEARILGAGVSGMKPDERNVPALGRLLTAMGL